MTLIELMVALAIGAFLMIGAMTVFMQSRTTFRVTESVSRLQENARFALDALEPDIRMAHYWGLTTRSSKVVNRAAPAAAAGPGPATCGNNWTINLDAAIAGTNNSYTWGCAGQAPVEVNADTLVVRRVSEDPWTAALVPNTVYLQSARSMESRIFTGAVPAQYLPPSVPPTSLTYRLFANGYYGSRSSSLGPNVPSLRMKTLVGGGAIQDQEVLAGVEDLQIQFGVDTDPIGAANRGSIDRYVNPGDPILDPASGAFIVDAEILSVRIWLRVRAERAENGFTDTVNYVYADQNVAPPLDNFRRILVSKTIYLRNARPPA
jgi:type IV pilus assembly protein PilW